MFSAVQTRNRRIFSNSFLFSTIQTRSKAEKNRWSSIWFENNPPPPEGHITPTGTLSMATLLPIMRSLVRLRWSHQDPEHHFPAPRPITSISGDCFSVLENDRTSHIEMFCFPMWTISVLYWYLKRWWTWCAAGQILPNSSEVSFTLMILSLVLTTLRCRNPQYRPLSGGHFTQHANTWYISIFTESVLRISKYLKADMIVGAFERVQERFKPCLVRSHIYILSRCFNFFYGLGTRFNENGVANTRDMAMCCWGPFELRQVHVHTEAGSSHYILVVILVRFAFAIILVRFLVVITSLKNHICFRLRIPFRSRPSIIKVN